MNQIVIEFCKEDRQRLDELIGFAGLLVAGMKERPFIGLDLAQGESFTATLESAEVPVGLPVGLPVEGAAHLDPVVVEEAPAPAPEVKPISLGEFQKAIVNRCVISAAMKEKVQQLIHRYAPSVSEIPEAKRAEVLAELAKL